MPTREDADRLENDVYTGLNVGILLDMRLSEVSGKQERYIRQVGFFDRDIKHNKNGCVMAVYQGKLMEDMIPEYIREKMHKAGIENPFFNKDVYDILCHDEEKPL